MRQLCGSGVRAVLSYCSHFPCQGFGPRLILLSRQCTGTGVGIPTGGDAFCLWQGMCPELCWPVKEELLAYLVRCICEALNFSQTGEKLPDLPTNQKCPHEWPLFALDAVALRDQIQDQLRVSFAEIRFRITLDFCCLTEHHLCQSLTKQLHASSKTVSKKMQGNLLHTCES